MSEQEDLQNLADVVLSMKGTEKELTELSVRMLGIANFARKGVLFANKKIKGEVEGSSFNERELFEFMKFIESFMQGMDQEDIFQKFHVSPELQERLINMPLNW